LKIDHFTFYLDFDGVIADSAQECIKTSFDAWLKYNKEILEMNIKKDFESFRDLVTENALKYRFLVTPPEHYYCLIDFIAQEILSTKIELTNKSAQKKFRRSTQTASPKLLEKFKVDFFLTRKDRLEKYGKSNWLLENPPTKFLEKFLNLIKQINSEIIIISRKDRNSISLWLDEKKINVSQIFCNEKISQYDNSKFNLIEHLQSQKNYKKGIFIDDSAEEIISKDWKSISITPIIAGWGYNLKKDNSESVLKQIQTEIL
tara:strand:+ start:565 stop:1344 length:780 start_codon:yes stop_codon:yes gene_type:complete